MGTQDACEFLGAIRVAALFIADGYIDFVWPWAKYQYEQAVPPSGRPSWAGV